ncbi:MAG: hypothetical protein IJX65_04345 [Alistipes sp.]|nr:hypothetical protein [Alistipes sp.]
MNDREIRELLDLYLEGETTLEQEQQIAEYFASAQSVAKELMPYRVMFAAFGQAREEAAPVAPVVALPRWRVIWGSVGSVAVAACVVVALFFVQPKSTKGEIICHIDGREVTDPQRAADEAARILDGVAGDMEMALAAIEKINIQI